MANNNFTALAYQQSPLDPSESQIRLLEILPGSGVIKCSLHRVSLKDKPVYIALSYVWGDPRWNRGEIEVNGERVYTTHNLYVALRGLRQPKHPVIVWADAICINQLDINERGHQVALMWKIYEAAENVVCWIGHYDHDDNYAVRFMRSYKGSSADKEYLQALKTKDSRTWKSLMRIWSLEYWQRTWVVQEIAVGRNVVLRLGPQVLDLHEIDAFVNEMHRVVDPHAQSALMAPMRTLKLSKTSMTDPIVPFLRSASYLKATEPHDKIYGLLGVFPSKYRERIIPDYSKSVPELYRDIAQLYIEMENDLTLLFSFSRYAGPIAHPRCDWITEWPPPAPVSLPSWVPNLDSAIDGLSPYDYRPTCGQGSKIILSQQNALLMKGIHIGPINEVGEYFKPRVATFYRSDINDFRWKIKPSGLEAMKARALSFLEKRYSNSDPETINNIFWAMAATPTFLQSVSSSGGCPFSLEEIWDAAIASEKRLPYHPYIKAKSTYFRAALERIINRTFFALDNGYIGLGPPDTELGDIACVLFGCNLCVILRPKETHYTFVGPAYIDGAMDGEYVKLFQQGGESAPELSSFEIK